MCCRLVGPFLSPSDRPAASLGSVSSTRRRRRWCCVRCVCVAAGVLPECTGLPRRPVTVCCAAADGQWLAGAGGRRRARRPLVMVMRARLTAASRRPRPADCVGPRVGSDSSRHTAALHGQLTVQQRLFWGGVRGPPAGTCWPCGRRPGGRRAPAGRLHTWRRLSRPTAVDGPARRRPTARRLRRGVTRRSVPLPSRWVAAARC